MIKGPRGGVYAGGDHGGGFGRNGFADDDFSWSPRRMNHEGLQTALSPLIRQLELYDAHRTELESRNVTPAKMVAMMEILKRPLVIEGCYREHKVALIDQASLRGLLRDMGEHECRVEVRTSAAGLPLYYLPRVRPDYRSVYSLVIEDLYQSEGYPIGDERFVKIMWGGHELYFLCLSQFRQPLLTGDDAQGPGAPQAEVDALLLKVGRHVFQACWHEDQHVGLAAAAQFNLVHFRRAVELLYLCLSVELCELRSACDEAMLQFFKEVYAQPAISAFFVRLAFLDGKALAEVPQAALRLFPGLSRAFSRFLALELPWGRKQAHVPLYKLLFANFSRLDTVREAIAATDELNRAAEALEKQSRAVILSLLEDSGDLYLNPDQGHGPLIAVN
jgi:hypothetical protein